MLEHTYRTFTTDFRPEDGITSQTNGTKRLITMLRIYNEVFPQRNLKFVAEFWSHIDRHEVIDAITESILLIQIVIMVESSICYGLIANPDIQYKRQLERIRKDVNVLFKNTDIKLCICNKHK